MEQTFEKCPPQVPHMPAHSWARAKRVCMSLFLCALAMTLFSKASPFQATQAPVAVHATAVHTLPTIPDFADAHFARAQQTADWRYDAQWAQEYSGLATYRYGNNFVTCGAILTSHDAQAAAQTLLTESGLLLSRETQEDAALQCYTATLDGAQVRLYLLAQQGGGATALVWAQAYLAKGFPSEMQRSAASVEAFVQNLLQLSLV